MEIIQFIVGLMEVLANWRSALMFVIGLLFAFIILLAIGMNMLGIVLAIVVLAGFFLTGLRWQEKYERRYGAR